MRHIFLSLLVACISISRIESIAPINDYLANSPWPIAQHDCYAQASTDSPGPLAAEGVDHLFSADVAGPLTMLYTPDEKVIWGSSFKSVFKVDRSEKKLRLIDAIEKPKEWRQGDTFRGIYNILSKENIFYISCGNFIAAYTDADQNDSLSDIQSIGTYEFKSDVDEKERVLALSMSYDGQLVFLTNRGGVGILSRFLDELHDFKYVTNHPVKVTNSMSIDEYGGIYVVTSKHMHRLWWNGSLLYTNPPPSSNESSLSITPCDTSLDKCAIWSTLYPVEDDLILGRPTKEGSGTTPSLLLANGKLYVMIADGRIKQNVLAIDTESGDIVASARVSFENDEGTESYTEQSILVSDTKFLVTQNALTDSAQRINNFLKLINAENLVADRGLPEFIEENVYLLPVVLGDNPRGYQQFELDVSKTPPEIRTVWTRNDVGCPNAIPTMSQSTQSMYCVGQRARLGNGYPNHSFAGIWNIVALDWNTGKTIFQADTGHDIQYNSLYAATQIGPNREIIYGSIGGIVRLRGLEAGESASSGILSYGLLENLNEQINLIPDTDLSSVGLDTIINILQQPLA